MTSVFGDDGFEIELVCQVRKSRFVFGSSPSQDTSVVLFQ